MVRETVDEEEAFSENRKPLTTKDTKDTELPQHAKTARAGGPTENGLPRMDADERGLQGEESSREIEFVPGSVLQTEPYAILG
jgi:hypothetical protein